jgi:hypothetical protein
MHDELRRWVHGRIEFRVCEVVSHLDARFSNCLILPWGHDPTDEGRKTHEAPCATSLAPLGYPCIELE